MTICSSRDVERARFLIYNGFENDLDLKFGISTDVVKGKTMTPDYVRWRIVQMLLEKYTRN